MSESLPEEEARRALSKVGSPAADSNKYRAHRIDGGWSFRWQEDAGPPLIGTIGWIVTDAGQCGSQMLQETAEDAMRRLAEANTREDYHKG